MPLLHQAQFLDQPGNCQNHQADKGAYALHPRQLPDLKTTSWIPLHTHQGGHSQPLFGDERKSEG